MSQPVALVTGVGRPIGIAAGIADRLAADGWDLAISYWTPYDERMSGQKATAEVEAIRESLLVHGGRVVALPADLTDPTVPAHLFALAAAELGPISALVMSHAESIDSGILDTSLESFDRHFAVNARASWLLIREFALQFIGAHGTGRIVALTSDHTRFNLPYGASKGALDRIVIAASGELADRGISANVVNPGPINTGWMTPELETELTARTPAGRLGTPRDTADLVSFLLSEHGGWISGQLIKSDGGFGAEF